MSIDELKLTLDSVKVRQKFFANKELVTLYGPRTKELLTRYFSLYSGEGFSDHVAIDDCEVGQFAKAIIGPDSSAPSVNPSTTLSSSAPQADPPIVLNSCRKYQGVKLVTCLPNGKDPKDGYTIYHCGELM